MDGPVELAVASFHEEEGAGEVLDELKQQNIANKLIIYWDEFTSVLELQNSGVLLAKLQDIAELTENKNIYLFVVSHRNAQGNLRLLMSRDAPYKKTKTSTEK